MSDVDVRRATVADAEALAAVYRSAYQENARLGFPMKAASATAAEVAEWIEDGLVFVAVTEGEIVGGVRLQATDDDRAKLSRLAVREAQKGEGIGTRLLDRAEAAAREWDREVVWLTTPEEHPFLPELYRNRGYEETGEHPLPYREYDEIVMEKRVGGD